MINKLLTLSEWNRQMLNTETMFLVQMLTGQLLGDNVLHPDICLLVLSPFLIGRMFLREPSWEYSANLAGS